MSVRWSIQIEKIGSAYIYIHISYISYTYHIHSTLMVPSRQCLFTYSSFQFGLKGNMFNLTLHVRFSPSLWILFCIFLMDPWTFLIKIYYPFVYIRSFTGSNVLICDLPLTTNSWSRVGWFANNFHEWRSPDSNVLFNDFTSDHIIVIHSKSHVIIFLIHSSKI